MQFTAYLPRTEIDLHTLDYAVPISRIAQIFAADIMPKHSRLYAARCTASGVDTDKVTMTSWPLSNGTPILVPPALTTTSQYTFHGYHPGLLESFLLQPSFTLPVVSRAGAISSPIPGVPSDHQLNSALKRIRIDVAKRAIVATPSTVHTPQPKKAGSSKHVPSQMGLGNRQKHTMLQQPVEGSRPKGSVL